MESTGIVSHYVMDGDRPLTAETSGNTTFYLYGLGAIGEKTTAWSYSLPDGTNTPRQLSDNSGDITLTSRYTPWGDTLDTHGTGGFTFGYFGGVMDAATGLLYVGNGQYYDPATGRFLTRNVNPDSTNPYTPWNPIGAVVGPLGLLSMFYSRKKKGGRGGMFLVLLLVMVTVGMTLSACVPGNPTTTTPPPSNPNPNPTQTPGSGTIPPDTTSTPIPPVIILTLPDCPTAPPTSTATPVPTATSISIEAQLALHSVVVDLTQLAVERRQAVLEAILEAVINVDQKLSETVIGANFRAIYDGVNITWGLSGAFGQCASIGVGGCTTSRHQINFVTISDDPLRARNNVVHELGHAFSDYWSYSQSDADRAHPENTHPGIVLGWTQGSFPAYTEYIIFGFPNRPDPVNKEQGQHYGFYSRQNVLTWQVAVTNAGDPSEEFADQFLGWTFDTWEDSTHGTLRRDWMNNYMPGWISSILRG